MIASYHVLNIKYRELDFNPTKPNQKTIEIIIIENLKKEDSIAYMMVAQRRFDTCVENTVPIFCCSESFACEFFHGVSQSRQIVVLLVMYYFLRCVRLKSTVFDV